MAADGAVIQLVTRCTSVDEFIERFARFTTENDVVVPALPHVKAGTAGHFVISLKDGAVMMKGQCEVTEIRPAAAAAGGAPAGPPLMRLRLREMDAHSCGIHLRLMERHASSAKPPARPAAARPTPAPALSLVPPLRSVPPVVAEARPAPVVPPKPPAVSTTQVMGIPRPPVAPRSVPAATPPPPVTSPGRAAAAAVAVAVVAPSPAEPDAERTAAVPSAETRAAGAAFTLPANPLSDLDAADLASFVELTLLESNAAAEAPAAGDTAVTSSDGAAQPAAVAQPEPSTRTAVVDRKRLAATVAATTATTTASTRLDHARGTARRMAPYAACVLGGVLLGIVLAPGKKAPPKLAAAPVAAPPVAVVSPPPAPSLPPEESAGPAPRSCVARVTTTPPGAEVHWGDIALGPSPILQASVPCGTAIVTFRRERYADVSRTIVAQRGPETVVAQRMNRPPAKLVVASSPPGASLKFNKRRFGATPRAIAFMRYEHVRLEVSSPGYEPWKKTLYLKDAETRVDVKLVRASSSPPRRSPR